MAAIIEIETIQSREQLEEVKPFQIEELLWGTHWIPVTYGYIGFVREEGFYLKMICEEKDPVRLYKENQSPVYRDSAMEAFFKFNAEKGDSENDIYLNFEFNANGALLAAYGTDRIHRVYFEKEDLRAFSCHALIEEERWSVRIYLPLFVLEKIYGSHILRKTNRFWCNFYKISENPSFEHYAAYSRINTILPDFHQPRYFAEAKIL